MKHRQAPLSKTADQVRAELRAQGKSIEQWAREKGFPSTAVRNALTGRVKGLYGQGHTIMVALGMKDQGGTCS